MTKTPVVLLCAPAGSGLSRVARELTESDHLSAVQDLETRLCDSYVGHASHEELGLQEDETPKMCHVVRRPREELYAKWKRCFGESIKRCAASPNAPFRLVCMHLSWYNPNSTEFFSPVSVNYIKRAASLRGCSIDQVIILIDDIYDMYHRLQGPYDIYRPEAIEARGQRLHALHHQSEAPILTNKQSHLEAVESALVHLIAWRQHEILHTENLARELGARFTVLGIKHSKEALRHVLKNVATSRTYLSHRISEVRRMNKSTSDLPDKTGTWSHIVEEVNQLHFLFAQEKQLLINPTAIDELRFGDLSDDEKRRPFLAARWNVPEPFSDLLWECAGDDYQYTKLLCDDLHLPNPTATSVARSLSNRIYFDISFRDHVIVEHTPGLCVYRPFFKEAITDGGVDTRESTSENSGNRDIEGVNWSGGVKPELTHWYLKTLFEPETRRRAAFVHTRQEIRSRMVWLRDGDQKEFAETMSNHLCSILQKHDIPEEDAKSISNDARKVLSLREKGSHLAQDPAPQTVQLPQSIRDNVDALVRSLEVAYTLAIYHSFTLLTRPQQTKQKDGTIVYLFDVCMILGYESCDADRRLSGLDEVAEKLCRFFMDKFRRGCTTCQPSGSSISDNVDSGVLCIECEEMEVWKEIDLAFEELMRWDLFEFCCRILALPYEYVKERSSYLQETLATRESLST